MSRLARRTVAGVSPSGTTHYLALAGGGGDFAALMPGLGAAMGGLGIRILAEIDDATGTTTREYLWLGDRVVAVAPAGPSSATLYYVTTDHLTRPVQMTGPSKAVVWRAKYGPFGEVLETTGPTSLAARHPGQWFQLENGLAWNWHRHYDASLGRYVQPDPLGLVDGPSVYGYVRQNPVMGVDPEGLKFPKSHPVCIGLERKINNLRSQIAKREMDYSNDGTGEFANGTKRMPLPERIGPGEKLGQTRRGHRTLMQIDRNQLKKAERQYRDQCDDEPPSSGGMGAGDSVLMCTGAAIAICLIAPEVCIPGALAGAAIGAAQ